MNFYEHHIGDYAEATAHLTFLEDAAYSRLIRKIYSTEEPLPKDLRAVERLIGARTKDEKAAVKAVLDEFFTLQADGWHNSRCDEELDRYHEKQAKAKKSAEARWNPMRSDSERNANGMRTHATRTAGASQTHNGRNALQSPVPSPQTPEKTSLSPPDVSVSTTGPGAADAHAREEGSAEQAKKLALGADLAHALSLRIREHYPPGTYRGSNWILAEREISKLLDGGEDPERLVELTRQFRAQQDSKQSTGTQFVLSPEKFFGADGHWRGPFPLPQATAAKRMRTGQEICALFPEEST